MGEPALELRDVAAAYAGADRPAIIGVSLTLGQGELGVVVGPNGAGKTTLLEVILGLLPYQAGSVRVFGAEVRAAGPALRRRVAYLPQDLVFPPDTPYLTRDVVMMGRFGRLRPWQRLPRRDQERAREALTAFGLADKAGWPIGHLSGGQQRKALLARAFAKEAALLLLDEPFSSLDPAARADLAQAILALRGEGMTVLAVLHEDVLLSEADRAFLMREGKLSELSSLPFCLEELWERPLPCGA
ncbi:MAG: metal ABC transporter ATP-binding protein [Candidatus Acetothermia bacterium]|nr:metal ABC transporter ATP-binding protein [Candidatus Acetothermia bacterium]